MRQEVPTWLAVVIILVVLVVVVGAYIYFTKPKAPTGVEHMPPHAPSGHHGGPIQKGPAPQQLQQQAQPQPQTQPQTQPQGQ
jgi:flagellar basal body-associated protein FliL